MKETIADLDASVNSLAVLVHLFCEEEGDPTNWVGQIESIFSLCASRSEKGKFYNFVAKLPPQFIDDPHDILDLPETPKRLRGNQGKWICLIHHKRVTKLLIKTKLVT